MKRIIGTALMVLAAFFIVSRETARGEGNILPPAVAFDTNGLPTAYMKTLDQIEPRHLITYLPYSITNSGSYYLAGNLLGVTNCSGITIDADNVELDLRGFTLIGSTNPVGDPNDSLTGIYISDSPIHKNITIRNGVVHYWGQRGIRSMLAQDCKLVGVSATYNGGTNGYDGMELGADWLVSDCLAAGNRGNGISTTGRCTVRNTIVRNNQRHGMSLCTRARVVDCLASGNSMDGIRVADDSYVEHCIADQNTSNGINAASGCIVRENQCSYNGNMGIGAGIIAGDECRIESNHLRKNQYGIQIASGSRSLVIRNSAAWHTCADYDMTPGTHYGVILTNNNLRANFTNDNPWANFSL